MQVKGTCSAQGFLGAQGAGFSVQGAGPALCQTTIQVAFFESLLLRFRSCMLTGMFEHWASKLTVGTVDPL